MGFLFQGKMREEKKKKQEKKKRLWKQNQWWTLRNHQYVC